LTVLVLALAPGANAGDVGFNTLTVVPAGTGNGNVSATDPGSATINCTKTGGSVTGTCQFDVAFGDPPQPYIGLQANPAAGSEFTSWSVSPVDSFTIGCGQEATCYVQMNSDVTVTANFISAPGFPVTVVKQGVGAGSSSVTSSAGINCTPTDQADCSHSVPAGTVVVFTATPGANTTFGGWGGSCAGQQTAVCTLTINQVTAITATFNAATQPLTVSIAGDGGVSSNVVNPGISCSTGNSGTCSANLAQGSQVSLTAHPDSGWAFDGWGGACAGNANPCVVTMSQAQNVTATFANAEVQASVQRTRIRMVGPRRAVRQLQVTINADEDLARIVIRVRRGNVTLQSRRIRNFDADTAVIRMNLRNGIAAGRAQVQVTMTNEAGNQKVQNRNLRIPRV